MINNLLHLIKTINEPISVSSLSERLRIEQSALEGILNYCAQKGILQVDNDTIESSGAICYSGNCGSSCSGSKNCAFIARMPKVYSERRRIRLNDGS